MSVPAIKDISVFYPYILVSPVKKEEEVSTDSGIYLPTNGGLLEAVVVKLPTAKSYVPENNSPTPQLQEGKKVFVKRFSYPISGSPYCFVEESDIFGQF